MKKLFSLILFTLFMANPLFADDQDDQITCYNAAVDFLKSSSKFRDVLPRDPRAVLTDITTCKDNGHWTGLLDPNVKKGDRVVNRLVDFDITLTFEPLQHVMEGSRETVRVRGFSGYLYDVDDSAFAEIDELRYNKARLR